MQKLMPKGHLGDCPRVTGDSEAIPPLFRTERHSAAAGLVRAEPIDYWDRNQRVGARRFACKLFIIKGLVVEAAGVELSRGVENREPIESSGRPKRRTLESGQIVDRILTTRNGRPASFPRAQQVIR